MEQLIEITRIEKNAKYRVLVNYLKEIVKEGSTYNVLLA